MYKQREGDRLGHIFFEKKSEKNKKLSPTKKNLKNKKNALLSGHRAGGASEGISNLNIQNSGGTALQPATFWNGTSYVVGGTNGRPNTATANDFIGGGGGGTIV